MTNDEIISWLEDIRTDYENESEINDDLRLQAIDNAIRLIREIGSL